MGMSLELGSNFLLTLGCSVQFWVLVGDKLFQIRDINKASSVLDVYRQLKTDKDDPAKILAKTTFQDCEFYKFDSPPLLNNPAANVPPVKTCLDVKEHWLPVEKTTLIWGLYSDEKFLSSEYICLVIVPPQGEVLLRSSG